MVRFILLTLFSYTAIDLVVYWLGKDNSVDFVGVFKHHLKALPIYLFSNIFITIGFLQGMTKSSPMILFSISILLWVASLLIVSMVLYRIYPNWQSLIGFIVIVIGVVVVHRSL